MAKGDITYYLPRTRGTRQHQVVSGGTPPAINAGEPVQKTLGNEYVITAANGTPVVGTSSWVGIAAGTPGTPGTSSETTSANGVIEVADFAPGDVFLAKVTTANNSTAFGASGTSQTTYNALVGSRVTMANASQVFTINLSDGSTNGLVIENVNLADYPSRVAFSIRSGAGYLN